MKDHDLEVLKQAVFERYESHTSWSKISAEYNVSEWKIRRAFKAWKHSDAQPQSHHDVQFDFGKCGRPLIMPIHHEQRIAEGVRYFALNNTPLTRAGVKDFVVHYVSLLSEEERKDVHFQAGEPSNTWLKSFSARQNLITKRIQQVEAARLEAVTHRNVAAHISRVQAAIDRFNIKSPSQIVNMDQTGMSFSKMVGRSLRRGFYDGAEKKKVLGLQKTLSAKGSLDRVTLMPVVDAAGKAYKPCVVYPGKLPHFRRVAGKLETLHDCLPDSYLYYNDSSAANSEIILDWGKKFVEETKHVRENGNHMILVLDGYGGHIQLEFLQFMKDNRIVVIALPAHTSHVLQPLDVTVFGPYKSYLQEELHRLSRVASHLNAFSVAACIWNAYSKAFVKPNIASGFVKCGIWNAEKCGADITPLHHLFCRLDNSAIPLEVVMSSYIGKERSLLRDVSVEEEGRIRINTSNGANVTAQVVLDALKKRQEKKAAAAKSSASKPIYDDDVKEGAEAIRRYAALADRRHQQRKRLRESRRLRRHVRQSKSRPNEGI